MIDRSFVIVQIPSLEVDSPSRKSVVSVPDGPYSELGEINSVNLLSFAYQIASGMVRERERQERKGHHYSVSLVYCIIKALHINFLVILSIGISCQFGHSSQRSRLS